MGQLQKKGKKKKQFVTKSNQFVTIREPNCSFYRKKRRVCCVDSNTESATGDVQPTGQNLDLDREFKADIARYWSQFTREFKRARYLFKSHNAQATSRTKEVNLASTRHTEPHEVTLDIMLQPRLQIELRSLMNYPNVITELILCNPFFAAFLRLSLSPRHRSVALRSVFCGQNQA
jgi:hypothetical protein